MTPSSVPLYGGGGGMTPSSVPLYGGGDGMTPSSVPLYRGGGGMTPSSVPLYVSRFIEKGFENIGIVWYKLQSWYCVETTAKQPYICLYL